MRAPICKNLEGFTLLEVLIAMSLLSIMGVLLYGSINIGTRSWNTGEKRAENATQMLIVQNYLRSSIANIRPLMDVISDEEPVFSFQGTNQSLQFVSTLPQSATRGGLYRFTMKPGDSENNKLVLSIEPFYRTLDKETAKIKDVELLRNLETIELTYYGPENAGALEARWVDNWEDQEFLPQIIKLDLQIEGDQFWPPLVITPRIEATSEEDLEF